MAPLLLAALLAQPAPDAALAARGEALFTEKGCAACHSVDGRRSTGPTLKGLWGSTVTLTTKKVVVADAAYVRESILVSTKKVVDGYLPLMPLFRDVLAPAEVDALVAYVKSLGAPPTPVAAEQDSAASAGSASAPAR